MRAIINKMILIMAGLFATVLPAWAEMAPADIIASDLSSRIILFRENLSANINLFAEAEGIPMEALPEWARSIDSAKPETMVWNSAIESAVKEKALDMAFPQPETQPAISGFAERLVSNGYNAMSSSETACFTIFMNFMPSQVAADVLFKSLIKKDLLQQDIQNATVLNPLRRDFALGVQPGSIVKNGMRYNSYNLSVGSAISYMSANEAWIEDCLFIMMNQARLEPLKTSAYLGMDFSLIEEIYPSAYFFVGAPRIIRIYPEEQTHVEAEADVIHSSPDPLCSMEFFIETPAFMDRAEVVKQALYMIIDKERTLPQDSRVIMRPESDSSLTELSISVKYVHPEAARLPGLSFKISVFPYSQGLNHDQNLYPDLNQVLNQALNLNLNQDQKMTISGVLFNDANFNGFFDPSEGVGACDIYAESGEKMVSGPAGSFSGELSVNTQRLLIHSGENLLATEWADWDKKFRAMEYSSLIKVLAE